MRDITSRYIEGIMGRVSVVSLQLTSCKRIPQLVNQRSRKKSN